MPTYEYKCPNGHITEEFRKIANRKDPAQCKCGKQAVLIISAPLIPMDIMSDKWARMHEKAGKEEHDPQNLSHV